METSERGGEGEAVETRRGRRVDVIYGATMKIVFSQMNKQTNKKRLHCSLFA